MAKEVKRGDIRVASTHTQNEDDDEEMVNLTTICIVGNALRDDQDLIKDAGSFGIKVTFSSDGREDYPKNEEIAYILEEFEGEIFEELRKAHKTIFGPTIIHQLAARGLTPQSSERPLYNFAMAGLPCGICFNHISKKLKFEIKQYFAWIQWMGGSVLKDISSPRVTHLVTDSCRGEKYRYASTFSIPVMSTEWIKDAWNHRKDVEFTAHSSKFADSHKVKPFHGAHVHFMGFEAVDLEVMTSELVRNGGNLCNDPLQNENCTHIVVADDKIKSIPIELMERRNVSKVKVEWFWASIQMDACAEEKLHLFQDENLYLTPSASNLDKSGSNGLFSPGTPGSTNSRRRKRRNVVCQLAANDPNPGYTKTRRSSISEVAMLSMSGSFLDSPSPDQTPTNATPGNKSNSNLLQIPPHHPSSPSRAKSTKISNSPHIPQLPEVDLKSMTPRQRVFNELVQTETNFVNVLKSILYVFKRPLDDDQEQVGAANHSGQLLNKTELNLIFGNLTPIYDVHLKMLTEFSQAQANWNDQISIGEIYLKYAQDLLKAYPPYVNYFEDSKKTLQECEKKNPRFYAFLKVCQSKPESGRQHLADLLMHPIQRLPRVILLLTDILKYTTREKPDHVDVGKLDTAVNKIKEVLTHINEDKRKTEGKIQIFEIFNDIENCPPDLVSSHRMFLNKIDVVELGGSDELCGKGYELSLFLFSDVLEISKKKSAAKGLGLRSPSTISLRSVGVGPAGTLNSNPGGNTFKNIDAGTKYFKHVNLMNLTAIKRVVDVTETQTDSNIFALVCRTNQELKERMFVFQIVSEDVDKKSFLRNLCRNVASTMCRPDPDTYLRVMRAEDLGLEPSDFSISNFSTIGRSFQKKVNRAFSFNKTPTSSRLKRAVSSMISPLSSSSTHHNQSNRMMSSTPTNDIAFQSLRLAASSANLLSPQRSNNHNHVDGENFMSPMPPPSMPPLSSLQTPKRGMASMSMSSPMDHDSSGFSIPKTPTLCSRRPSFKMKAKSLLGSGSKK